MSLPVSSPTESYWQSPPHPFASYRSAFPHSADVVVIGSGITGTSIAKTLFEHDPSLKIVILEARNLCSGATGRNGGHIKPCSALFVRCLTIGSYHHWSHRVEEYGLEEAIIMSRFENAHPSALIALGKQYDLKCDIRQLDTVDAYYDENGFKRATLAAHAISQHIPELTHQIYSGDEAQKKFRLSNSCVGAITYRAGQLWPYKLVTQIVEILVNAGVNLQTETPVTNVVRESRSWRIETPRGNILALVH
jgi:glycine/D-amino acid oxidase-like deaminating enzyme